MISANLKIRAGNIDNCSSYTWMNFYIASKNSVATYNIYSIPGKLNWSKHEKVIFREKCYLSGYLYKELDKYIKCGFLIFQGHARIAHFLFIFLLLA